MRLPRWLVISMLATSALAVLAAAGWCWWSVTAPQRMLRDRARIRAKYREYPSELLGITEPISDLRFPYYTDGGTRGVRLKDALGRQFETCIDGRLFRDSDATLDRGE